MRLHIHTLIVLLVLALSCFLLCFVFYQLTPNTCIFVFSPPPPSISRYLYTDPLHCNMTYMLLRLLKDDLKEYTYAARLAGLVYGIASGMNAILVSKPFEVWREVGVPMNGSLWGFCRLWKWLGFLKDLYKSLLVAAFPANPNIICHLAEYSPLEMVTILISFLELCLRESVH